MSHTGGTTRRSTSGQTLPLVVVFLLTLLLFCGAVIDIGNAYRVKQALQASADAAVAAGAGNLPNTGAATAAAHNLSAENTAKNRIAGVPNVTANITLDCSTSPNFCSPANTVHITETANIPTYFLRLIGINTITESVHSQACSPCGGLPLDVMIVLDRTGSMLQPSSKLANAKAGILSFLTGMDPAIDNVGLVVLPPATSLANACSTSDDQTYTDTTPAYLLVPLGNTYATSLGNLNSLVAARLDGELRPRASAARRTRSRSTTPTRSSWRTAAWAPRRSSCSCRTAQPTTGRSTTRTRART